MDRLTVQWGGNPAVPTKLDLAKFLDFSEDIWADFDDIIQRLAAYENTGFTPEEIKDKSEESAAGIGGKCAVCGIDLGELYCKQCYNKVHSE